MTYILWRKEKAPKAVSFFLTEDRSCRCRTAAIATFIIAMLSLAANNTMSSTRSSSPSSVPLSLHTTLSPLMPRLEENNCYRSSIKGGGYSNTMSRRGTCSSSSSSSIIGLIGGYKGKDTILHKKQAKLPKSKRIGARFRYRVKVRQMWTKKGHKKIYKARHHRPLKFKTHGDGEFRSDRIRNQAKRVAAGKGKMIY
mmetsp:Transcript_13121/g.21036  ORF Transcript_13121/g.21036 Transcript_13121/m.21036 type:complete len:197 (+) Transcript_13121:226-816(+)